MAADLEALTSKEHFWKDNKKAQKTLRELKQFKDAFEPWDALKKETEDTLELVELYATEAHSDEELASLEEMVSSIEKQFEHLEFEAMFSDEDDERNCYLYIHPGAGGTESCDWAEMLMRMYLRWCEERKFEVKQVDLQPGDVAGIKSVTIFVKGRYAYGYLKAETGVHRLVRLSPFDANHRRHTSFASVYASPEIDEDVEIELKEDDIRMDTFRSSGAGGQHVNVTDSAVRLTHIPTKIVVSCQNERSQHQNRAVAMKLLRSRLYQRYREKKQEELDAKSAEKSDIAWGSQIRSYVFHPYTLVKDHRTNVETSSIQNVMDGALDPFIESFLKGIRK